MFPYCFVLMPFGKKTDESGREINFDEVYCQVIAPAVSDAGLEPIRADEELIGGIIHKPMFERLMICDYAVADLTIANANVFYELGIRHGIRPHSTVPLYGSGTRLPFDVAPLRAMPYELDEQGAIENAEKSRKALTKKLNACRDPADDSPLYQLLTDIPRPNIQRLKTDTFREAVRYATSVKQKIKNARENDPRDLENIEKDIDLVDADPAIVIDLFLSYRAVSNWTAMVRLAHAMPPLLRDTLLVQEQLGFALNRAGRSSEAEDVLTAIIRKHGASSETNGILGRVYKDQWAMASDKTSPTAQGYLNRAIDTYLAGFNADLRDAYPGINAVTLMEVGASLDSRQQEILPVVQYAVKMRLQKKSADYWDYATLLELAVLSKDWEEAQVRLANSLASASEGWQLETTANNLNLIAGGRARREEPTGDIVEILNELNNRARDFPG